MRLFPSKLFFYLILAVSSTNSRGSVVGLFNQTCGQLLSVSSAALVSPWGKSGRVIDLAMQGLLFTSGIGNRRLLYRAMRSRLAHQSVLGVGWQDSRWGDPEAVLTALDTSNSLAAFISDQAKDGVTVGWRPLSVGVGAMYQPSAKRIYLSSWELAWLEPEFMALHEADHAFLHKTRLRGEHSGTLFFVFVYGVDGNFDIYDGSEMWTYPRTFLTILSDPYLYDSEKRWGVQSTLDAFIQKEHPRLLTRATAILNGAAEGNVEWKIVSGQIGEESTPPSCRSVKVFGRTPLNFLVASSVLSSQRVSLSVEIPTRLPLLDGGGAAAEGVRKLSATVVSLRKMQDLAPKLAEAARLPGEGWVEEAKAVAKEMIELSDTMLFDETDPLRDSP